MLYLYKNYAICNVQEDNPNRFLHFAMANNNVVGKQKIVKGDGKETIDYTLLIDLHNLKYVSFKDLAKKAIDIKRGNV